MRHRGAWCAFLVRTRERSHYRAFLPTVSHRKQASWCAGAKLVSSRNFLSETNLADVPGGRAAIAARTSGWSFCKARICPTRRTDTPARSASSVRFATSPRSRRPCHSSADRSRPTRRGTLTLRSSRRFLAFESSMTKVDRKFLLGGQLGRNVGKTQCWMGFSPVGGSGSGRSARSSVQSRSARERVP